MTVARAFAPATVSNLACGFDILGFAISGPGDGVTAVERPEPGVLLTRLEGDEGRLPRETHLNTASVAVECLLERLKQETVGISLELQKGLPIGSGLGSSAAVWRRGGCPVGRFHGLLDIEQT